MSVREATEWVVIGSIIMYVLWVLVLWLGTPLEKAEMTAVVVASPIPPVP